MIGLRQSMLKSGLIVMTALAAMSVPAAAKKASTSGPVITMSEGFRAAAQAADSAIKAGDANTAQAQISSLTPVSDYEAYVAAALRFELAVLKRNFQGQRVALTDMFKTNSVPKKDAPRLR